MAGTLQARKEEQARRLEKALEAMARARRRERTLPRLLQEVLDADGKGDWRGCPAVVRQVATHCAGYRLRPPRGPFKRVFGRVASEAPRLLEAAGPRRAPDYIPALFRAAENHRLWIRPPEEWRPTGHSPSRQFSGLVRHLFAAYRVPPFMDSVFFLADPFDRVDWFYHLGTGKNIRTAPDLTAPLTKRMAHHFLFAPDEADMLDAVRWGQVVGMGGSPRLARAVCGTWMGRQLERAEEEAWWSTVLQWLVNHPMLDPARVGPIFDYLQARRGGDPEQEQAPDRAFSMKGRSPEALLRLVDEWHEEQRRFHKPTRAREFRPSGFQAGRWEFGSPPRTEIWTVTELLTFRALVEEGRAMRHCVATYADSVERGRAAIWSVKVDRLGAPERAVTVEVDPHKRAIVQVRGKLNRSPVSAERRILELWGRENGLRLEC